MGELSQDRASPQGPPGGTAAAAPGQASSDRTKAPAGASGRTRRDSVQSVERALSLIDVLAGATGSVQLTELAERTHLNVSTGHHLLATLVKWGYVARAPGRRYALGARGLHLAQAFLKQIDLPRRAQPYVEHISEETGETVHLAVLQDNAAVTLLKREGRHPVRVETGAVGSINPAHAAAVGKAMLAWLPESEIRRILAARGMPRLTSYTITGVDALLEELRLVRRHGHAMDREESQPGVTGVGAAIRNHLGAVVGAVSASAPTSRVGETHLARMRESVMAAARALSAEFGEQGAEAVSLEGTGHP